MTRPPSYSKTDRGVLARKITGLESEPPRSPRPPKDDDEGWRSVGAGLEVGLAVPSNRREYELRVQQGYGSWTGWPLDTTRWAQGLTAQSVQRLFDILMGREPPETRPFLVDLLSRAFGQEAPAVEAQLEEEKTRLLRMVLSPSWCGARFQDSGYTGTPIPWEEFGLDCRFSQRDIGPPELRAIQDTAANMATRLEVLKKARVRLLEEHKDLTER